MLCIPANWRDIERYFSGTFVKFREHGDRLFYIDRVRETEITGTCEGDDPFIVYMHNDHPYELDYVLPRKAVFQYKNDALILQRMPARQYRRGLCDDNTRITKTTGGDRLPLSFTLLSAFVTKQKYFNPEEALFGKTGARRSLALSNRMSFDKQTARLLIDMTPIAQLDRDRGILQANGLFADEIKSVFKNPIPGLEIIYG